MEGQQVLSRLLQDKPLFHFAASSVGQASAAAAGVELGSGETSWAVAPSVLRWLTDHVSGTMTTLETGAGYTTVMLTAIGAHHYCCTPNQREADKITEYLRTIGVPTEKVTFLIGSTDAVLPALPSNVSLDFAYIDGCHGYPFPALDWHYIDKHLADGGIIGMDNAELRPVREHCEFLEENGAYEPIDVIMDGYFVRFYRKLSSQDREWIEQPYSRAKRDPCDWRLSTRVRRAATRLIKPHLF